MKFKAMLNGIDVSMEDEDSKKTVDTSGKAPAGNPVPLFGDPDEYRLLSKEEADALTSKMKGQHQSWVDGNKPLNKPPSQKR